MLISLSSSSFPALSHGCVATANFLPSPDALWGEPSLQSLRRCSSSTAQPLASKNAPLEAAAGWAEGAWRSESPGEDPDQQSGVAGEGRAGLCRGVWLSSIASQGTAPQERGPACPQGRGWPGPSRSSAGLCRPARERRGSLAARVHPQAVPRLGLSTAAATPCHLGGVFCAQDAGKHGRDTGTRWVIHAEADQEQRGKPAAKGRGDGAWPRAATSTCKPNISVWLQVSEQSPGQPVPLGRLEQI